MSTCPFCGNADPSPIENGWWCARCSREYPTIAFKCPQPDCWEYEIACTKHAASAGLLRAQGTTPENTIQKLAKAYRNKLLVWLTASLLVALIAGSIADWSEGLTRWESRTVSFVFGLVGVVALFTFAVFCVLLYSWVSGYAAAMKSAPSLSSDRATFFQVHRDVFGPIPWR